MWGARGNPGGAGRSELLVRQRVYKQRQFAGTDEREGRRVSSGRHAVGRRTGGGVSGRPGSLSFAVLGRPWSPSVPTRLEPSGGDRSAALPGTGRGTPVRTHVLLVGRR